MLIASEEAHFAKKYGSIINLPMITIEEARNGKLHDMVQEELDRLGGSINITEKFMYPGVNIEFNYVENEQEDILSLLTYDLFTGVFAQYGILRPKRLHST